MREVKMIHVEMDYSLNSINSSLALDMHMCIYI